MIMLAQSELGEMGWKDERVIKSVSKFEAGEEGREGG